MMQPRAIEDRVYVDNKHDTHTNICEMALKHTIDPETKLYKIAMLRSMQVYTGYTIHPRKNTTEV